MYFARIYPPGVLMNFVIHVAVTYYKNGSKRHGWQKDLQWTLFFCGLMDVYIVVQSVVNCIKEIYYTEESGYIWYY